MKSLLNKYKIDILFISIILILFAVLSLLISKCYVYLWIDLGREAYFPELMLKGKLLYRDIFNIFGPLAYQINALLYKVFGVKISTLGIAGNFCSGLILLFTYFISRVFLSSKISFCISLFVLINCVFSIGVFNFIYPYSYAMLYAYASFMVAVFFFLYVLKNREKDYFLIISYFFMGISIAAKYEFIPFVLILLAYSIFIFRQNFLKILFNIFSLLIIPCISYAYLLYQGVTINDYLNNFHYLIRYASSETLHYFYSNTVGALLPLTIYKRIIPEKLFVSCLFLVLYVLSFYAISCSSNKPKYINFEYLLTFLGVVLAFFIVIAPSQIYLFVPYIIYGIFIYEMFKGFKNKGLKIFDDIFFIFILISIISLLKTCFFLDIMVYGSFTIILPFIVIVYFLSKMLSKYCKSLLEKNAEILVLSLILILALPVVRDIFIYIDENFIKIEFEKVSFYANPSSSQAVKQMFKYVEENIPKDKTLMIFSEGVFVNYATGRDMKLYNYQSLTPPYVDAFGVEKIISDLQKAKIDYIILTPRSSEEYGGGLTMCEINSEQEKEASKRYEERKICSYIKSSYNLEENIKNLIFIYKLKK